MLADIECIDQSIDVGTHNFSPPQINRFLSISSILSIDEKLLILV